MKFVQLAIALTLSSPGIVTAAPVGNPTTGPDPGITALDAFADSEHSVVTDSACSSGDCEGVRSSRVMGARLQLRPVQVLVLYADIGALTDSIPAAAYQATGWSAGAGLSLSVPISSSWHLGGALRYGVSAASQAGSTVTSNDDSSDDQDTEATQETGIRQPSESSGSHLRLAAIGTWSPGDGRIAFYGGPCWQPIFQLDTHLETDDLEYTFALREPLGAVAGVELGSDPLGLPWARHQSVLRLGFELRRESGWGGGGWMGLVF